MTTRLCGLLLTLSILILLAACSSTKDKAGSSTVPSAAVSSPATDAPKASDNAAASPQATPVASPTAAPQVSTAPTTTPTATIAATPKPSIAVTVTPKPSATNTDTSTAAAALFKQNCVTCHGVELQGGFGPNLQKVGSRLTKEQITKQIHDGGGDMPPFETKLKAEEIQIIAAWLSSKNK